MKKNIIFIGLTFLSLLISLSLVYAYPYSQPAPNLNPRVEICVNDAFHCYNKNKEIMNTDSLILKITITNKQYGLICLDEGNIQFDFYKEPLGKQQNIRETFSLPKQSCIPKNEEQSFYIPLIKYANEEPEKRIHKWIVSEVKLTTKLECYNSFDTIENEYDKNLCYSYSSKEYMGDKRIEIIVSGTALSLKWWKDIKDETTRNYLRTGFIISTIAFGVFLTLSFTLKKKGIVVSLAIVCFIIALILGGGGYLT